MQITYREITDIKWLRRYGGAAGDLVLTLQDGAKVPPAHATPHTAANASCGVSGVHATASAVHAPPASFALALAALAACARDSLSLPPASPSPLPAER